MEFQIQGLDEVYSHAKTLVQRIKSYSDKPVTKIEGIEDDDFDKDDLETKCTFATGPIELPHPFKEVSAEIEFVYTTYTLDIKVPILPAGRKKLNLSNIATSLSQQKLQLGRKSVFILQNEWPEYGISIGEKDQLLFFAGDKGTRQRPLPQSNEAFQKDIQSAISYLQIALNNIAGNRDACKKYFMGFYKQD